jgi:hypothetical protein
MARGLTVVLLAAIGLAACGGGNDKEDAEQVVRDFIKATNNRDADKLCDDLLSEEFIEQSTGATGDQARKTCKQQFKLLQPVKRKLVRITGTKVDGDKASVKTILETQSQPQPQTFSLTKVDGDWRLAGGTGG